MFGCRKVFWGKNGDESNFLIGCSLWIPMETTELEFEIPFRLTNEPWNSFLTDTFKFHVWWILQPFGQGRRNLIPIFLFYLKTKIPSLRILKILEVKSLVISSILKSIQFLLSNSFLYRAKPREWWITIPLSRILIPMTIPFFPKHFVN